MAEEANRDERWEVEGGEDNVVLNSMMLAAANNIPDDQSSSATSYSASDSPSHHPDQASIPEDAQSQRRLSIDQLTEEAEADLANNNDPNNNASSGADAQVQDLNLQISDDHEIGEPSGGFVVGSTAATVGGDAKYNYYDDDDDDDDDLEDPFQIQLQNDIDLILKLMPDRSYDEVRFMLESHRNNPSRVQVVLNDFLEQTEEPTSMKARDSTSPVPVRNKAGNGLKCKNSKAKKSNQASNNPEASSSSSSSSNAASSSGGAGGPEETVWSNLVDEEDSSASNNSTVARKRKKPLLDLNLEDHILPEESNEDAEEEATAPKRSKLDVMSAKSSRSSSGRSTPKDSRHKIQLSEDQLHGPFNFMDHRPSRTKSKNQSSSNSTSKVKFKAMNDNLQQIMEESNGGNSKSPAAFVDLSNENSNSPPVLVDLSQSDSQEIRDLFTNLLGMFPTTPKEYLEEQAEELAGKPVALERFISEHLARNSLPPDYWQPRIVETIVKQEQEPSSAPLNLHPNDQGLNMTLDAMDNNEEPKPGPSREGTTNQPAIVAPPVQAPPNNETIDLTDSSSNKTEENDEDLANKRLETLVALFPQTDPEFLHQKAVELGGDKDAMNRWIEEGVENNAKDFPSRAEYEKRQKEAELLDKYSGQVTVQEILDMYDDPDKYFMDKTRQVSELYKKHSLNQLKKEFRQISVMVINKIFTANNGLFVPCVRSLKKYSGVKRKTRRPDHECPMPQEIDINFLKELQYSRKEEEIKQYIKAQQDEHEKLVQEARKNGQLMECKCCFNDDCLIEDMLPCQGKHLFCKECVQRASEVAIGEGKHQLACLGECQEVFSLSVLQKALKANTFSKWLSRIQIAEIERADIDGLEQCPFCPFATIMDSAPEENKVFICQNPDCGKESCRLCKEISHIPLRCEEVEKDAEVRKRTYIENKMTEAMIRKCWKCSKPFVKTDGCNKMTCECGASMCYLCREPVRDYKHFVGQGGLPGPGQQCPLWSDDKSVHEREVARGALEAKNEMDKENPEVKLKHDPAQGMDLKAAANKPDRPRHPNLPFIMGGGHHHHHHHAPHAMPAEIPPGLVGILPDDPFERQRMIREQERIEAVIQGRGGPAGFPGGNPFAGNPFGMHHPAQPYGHLGLDDNYDLNGFAHRMGELLHLREAHRQRQRQIRRREQQALEELAIRAIRAPPGAPQPPPPAQPVVTAAGGRQMTRGVPQGGPPQPPTAVPPAHLAMTAGPIPPPPMAHGHGGPPHAHQRGGPAMHFPMNQQAPQQRWQGMPAPQQRIPIPEAAGGGRNIMFAGPPNFGGQMAPRFRTATAAGPPGQMGVPLARNAPNQMMRAMRPQPAAAAATTTAYPMQPPPRAAPQGQQPPGGNGRQQQPNQMAAAAIRLVDELPEAMDIDMIDNLFEF